MPFRSLSPEDVISGGTRLVRAGLEGGKSAVAHGKPALERAANLTAQAANWGAQNPASFACAAVGATGALVFVAPGLVSIPLLSSIGFTANGIQAGSAAAAAHSQIGNIVCGSAMAITQSAGAGGSGLVIVNGVTQLGGCCDDCRKCWTSMGQS
ncbi:hypothetical protein N7526_003341 [Penicillium atrosanguineum]|nr:hypothetical protein N7526_003341 [Penicillium atrosanguineum]